MQILWDDGERSFSRELRSGVEGDCPVLVARPAAEQPRPGCLERLSHEFGLRDELDRNWAVQPREMVREGAHMQLVLDDPGGVPLVQLLIAPMETTSFLRCMPLIGHRTIWPVAFPWSALVTVAWLRSAACRSPRTDA